MMGGWAAPVLFTYGDRRKLLGVERSEHFLVRFCCDVHHEVAAKLKMNNTECRAQKNKKYRSMYLSETPFLSHTLKI